MNQTHRTYNQRASYTQHCGVDTGNPSSDEQVQWTCEPKTSETPTLMTKLHYPSSGKEKDPETGLSYFGARYYEPEMLNIWLSVDPMADKYPNLSPYNYCAWNPIKLVDPDGRDIWELDNKGQLIWREKSETDQIRANGKYVSVAEGILESGSSYMCENKSYSLNFEDNASNAIEVFEFMADNSSVEFSLLGLAMDPSNNSADRYLLSTSFDEHGDSHGASMAARASAQNRMRSHIHNHPGDNAYLVPSSPLNNGEMLIPYAGIKKGDDVGFSDMIRKGSPSCTFSIYGKTNKGGVYRPYALTDRIPDYTPQPSKVNK